MAESGCLRDVHAQNLDVVGKFSVDGLQGNTNGTDIVVTKLSSDGSSLVSENKSTLPNDNLNQDSSDLDDEIPF